MHNVQIVIFSLFTLGPLGYPGDKTLPGPLSLIRSCYIVVVIINDICCVIHMRFFIVTVSLGSSYKDQNIQEGMKRKRKKCGDRGKAGELNFTFESLVTNPPDFLIFVPRATVFFFWNSS